MTTWFTSDLHLGHARICELAERPFVSVEEHDAELVRRWNAIVAPDDQVFVLGDIAMGSLRASLDLVKTLKGQKLLVPGNHDRVSTLYRGSPAQHDRWRLLYTAAGLHLLDEVAPWWSPALGRHLLCHFPYDGDSHGEDRYAEARPRDDGLWLLHGHTHSRERVRGRQVHVGVDAWDYAPVSEDAIAALLT